jgi:hypothetical protein
MGGPYVAPGSACRHVCAPAPDVHIASALPSPSISPTLQAMAPTRDESPNGAHSNEWHHPLLRDAASVGPERHHAVGHHRRSSRAPFAQYQLLGCELARAQLPLTQRPTDKPAAVARPCRAMAQ